MASLSKCLKEITDISDIEKKMLHDAAKAYLDEGFSAQEANVGAVKDVLNDLEKERGDISRQVRKMVKSTEAETPKSPPQSTISPTQTPAEEGKRAEGMAGREAGKELEGKTKPLREIAPEGQTKEEIQAASTRPTTSPSKKVRPKDTIPASISKDTGQILYSGLPLDLIIDEIRNLPSTVTNIKKQASDTYDKLTQLGTHVLGEGKTKYRDFVARMKEILGDLWDRVKNVSTAIWRDAKQRFKDETGAVEVREPKKKKISQEQPPARPMSEITRRIMEQAEQRQRQAERAGNPFGEGERPPSVDRAREVLGPHFDQFMYWIVDKNRPIAMIQKKLGEVREDIDLFMSETQRPKIQAYKVKKAWEELITPFLEEMARNKVSLDELEQYALAKHAPEANDALRKANSKRIIDQILDVVPNRESKDFRESLKDDVYPEEFYVKLQEAFRLFGRNNKVQEIKRNWDTFSERPSGMTDAEARRIIMATQATRNFENLRKMLAEINNERLEILKDAGLLAEEEYNAYKEKYDFYVPLYREGYEDQSAGTGKGLQPAGRPVKTRMGSTRNVVDIVANSISNLENAINRAEKAKSAKVLLNLVKSNPDSELWTIEEVKKAPRYDNAGNIHLYPDIFNVAPNEMRFMVDGQQHLLKVNRGNKDAMYMLRTLKAQDSMSGPFMNGLAKVNQYLARINTSLSPEFVLSNFIRDIQTAGINIQDTGVESKQILRGVLKSARAIYNVERGKPRRTDLEGVYERFKAAGGKIGWADVHSSIENLSKKISREIETLEGKRPIRKNIRDLLDYIENANTAIENGVRLHSFKLAIEQGFSDKKAAQIASDLTVDFTKKGAAGPAINSLYLFANAGIQGSYRIMRAGVKSSKVRKIMASIIAAGFLNGLLQSAVGGTDEDDEDYYNKIDDYLRERNMIFMVPGSKGKHIKVPLPWGYNFFWNIGDELSKLVTKENYKPMSGAGRLASVFVNAFNPIQAGTLLQTLAPTIADPFAMVAENKNWFGGELMPDKMKFDRTPSPDSQRHWKSTGKIPIWVAKELNKLGGGNEVRPATIKVMDISPETLELIIDMAGGSMLRFFKDAIGTPLKLIKGEEVEMHKIPFVRRVAGQKSEWADSRQYRENVEDILVAKEELDTYKNTSYHEKLKKELIKQRRLIPFAKATERKLKTLKKLKNIHEAKGHKDKVKELETKINQEYLRFNKRYNSMMAVNE